MAPALTRVLPVTIGFGPIGACSGRMVYVRPVAGVSIPARSVLTAANAIGAFAVVTALFRRSARPLPAERTIAIGPGTCSVPAGADCASTSPRGTVALNCRVTAPVEKPPASSRVFA